MNIIFEDKALEELYTDGSTKSHQYYKLSKDVIKQYIKVVNFLKAARRVEDLFYIKSLHYEKKKGDLNVSIRLNTYCSSFGSVVPLPCKIATNPKLLFI